MLIGFGGLPKPKGWKSDESLDGFLTGDTAYYRIFSFSLFSFKFQVEFETNYEEEDVYYYFDSFGNG